MRLRIHRGTKEIGGTCIEVEAHGKRLALDVGLPLDAPDDEDAQEKLLPAAQRVRCAESGSGSGIVVTPAPSESVNRTLDATGHRSWAMRELPALPLSNTATGRGRHRG